MFLQDLSEVITLGDGIILILLILVLYDREDFGGKSVEKQRL